MVALTGIERVTAQYCREFVGCPWRDSSNYSGLWWGREGCHANRSIGVTRVGALAPPKRPARIGRNLARNRKEHSAAFIHQSHSHTHTHEGTCHWRRGFCIGSDLAATFLARGDEVTVFDNLSSGKIEHIAALLDHSRFRFVEGDLVDFARLGGVERQDMVYHLAANPDSITI
jgi:hypothetical protein